MKRFLLAASASVILLSMGAPALAQVGTPALPVALALVYLMTNESTRTVLDTQAKVEAVEADYRGRY